MGFDLRSSPRRLPPLAPGRQGDVYLRSGDPFWDSNSTPSRLLGSSSDGTREEIITLAYEPPSEEADWKNITAAEQYSLQALEPHPCLPLLTSESQQSGESFVDPTRSRAIFPPQPAPNYTYDTDHHNHDLKYVFTKPVFYTKAETSKLSDIDEHDISMEDAASAKSNTSSVGYEGSDEAVAAWNHRFNGRRQVELTRADKEPFMAGRRLGGGGVGIVHETYLDNIPLALKRTYTRRLSPHELNEIKILGRMSEKRHRHIVELVGSYVHQQRGGYELGLLIWPVAHTDLAAVLHDMEVLDRCLIPGVPMEDIEDTEIQTAMEPLMFLATWKTNYTADDGMYLYGDVQDRLEHSFGCIANAVLYLHEQKIRHKDLKPSQILISRNGLWLTDFGWSTDTSDLTHSTTSGGDNITTKYHAPERANKQPCGRAEDVFALACIFLEMGHAMLSDLQPLRYSRPWSQKGWSFCENLEHRWVWLQPMYEVYEQLALTIAAMLAPAAVVRPSMRQVIERLHNYDDELFDDCCRDPIVQAGSHKSKWPSRNDLEQNGNISRQASSTAATNPSRPDPEQDRQQPLPAWSSSPESIPSSADIEFDSDYLSCKQCGKLWTGSSRHENLRFHMKTSHIRVTEGAYICGIIFCETAFSYEDALLVHLCECHTEFGKLGHENSNGTPSLES